ncbi:MAG: ATP-binding protein [bacterium]|jgi:signal transduction histidine kinase|nr:ATP-binding protein [bacterium]
MKQFEDRLALYRQAALAMKEGHFDFDIPIEGNDELSKLGQALDELGNTLEAKFNEIKKLHEVTEQINSGLLLDEILNHVYEAFQNIIPYDRIGFATLDENQEHATAIWARTNVSTIRLPIGYSVDIRNSSLQHVMKSKMPRILNDLEAYLQTHPQSSSTREIVAEGMHSSLTCPLIAMNKPIGFLFFSSKEKHTYQDEHVDLFMRIARHLSIILEKSRLYQRLLELNQIKNKFLGIAAHDLRNPLGVVIGYLRLIQDGMFGPLEDRLSQTISTMERNCDKMLDLLNDLLDVSAIESGRLSLVKKPVNLEVFLTACVESYRILAKNKTIQLVLEKTSSLPQGYFDPDRIEQVLNNLITNAIKFSLPGTAIQIHAEGDSNHISISVTDQGPGIPCDELSHLFTPFPQISVKPTQGEKSTGLGLAIAKKIIDTHNGTITVKSQVGQGTTFTITLPRPQPPSLS